MRHEDHRLTDLLLQPHGDGTRASDYSSLDGRLGCGYDHSGFGRAIPAPTRASTSRSWFQTFLTRRDTINEWNSADANVGPFPYLQSREVLKDLARCFTNRSNPWNNDKPNINFQRYLNLMIEADREYLDNPTLSRLCAMVAELIFRWECMTHESMRGVNSSGSAPPQGKHSKGQKSGEPEQHHKDEGKAGDRRRCQGCNRVGHNRDSCRMTDHTSLSRPAYGLVVRQSGRFDCGRERNLRYSFHGLGELMVRHCLLLWCGRLRMRK